MIYDIVFVTNCPSFYKINLYNELADKCNIHVVFIGKTEQVVIDKDFNDKIKFDYSIISSHVHIDKRNKLLTFFKLLRCIQRLNFRFICWGGWDFIEFTTCAFLLPKKKNCISIESSIYESKTTGVKAIFKRIILNRISNAFVSGYPHKLLLQKLKFEGSVYITGGVGVFNKSKSDSKSPEVDRQDTYVFLGRLLEIKNLDFLIDAFNENGKQLSIVGAGPLLPALKSKAKSNINFLGFIENDKISDLLSTCYCLILPSLSEPWGLVVEEALYQGIPVIVSDKVGCNDDLVSKYNSGIIFDSKSKISFQSAIDELEQNYSVYKANAQSIDFENREIAQINAYLKIL